MTVTATPAKLANGTWGARVLGVPAVGAIVQVRTAGGKTWDARVVAIVRAGAGPQDMSLVATESLDRPSGRPARDSDESLADRGLIRVSGGRGSYVRKMNAGDRFDEYDM